MRYRATRTFGKFREGELYDIERLRLEERSAVRSGLLVAATGWCAPSEALYSMVDLSSTDGLLELPEVAVQPAKKPRKPRKAVTQPDTLESLAQSTSEALDGLRG